MSDILPMMGMTFGDPPKKDEKAMRRGDEFGFPRPLDSGAKVTCDLDGIRVAVPRGVGLDMKSCVVAFAGESAVLPAWSTPTGAKNWDLDFDRMTRVSDIMRNMAMWVVSWIAIDVSLAPNGDVWFISLREGDEDPRGTIQLVRSAALSNSMPQFERVLDRWRTELRLKDQKNAIVTRPLDQLTRRTFSLGPDPTAYVDPYQFKPAEPNWGVERPWGIKSTGFVKSAFADVAKQITDGSFSSMIAKAAALTQKQLEDALAAIDSPGDPTPAELLKIKMAADLAAGIIEQNTAKPTLDITKPAPQSAFFPGVAEALDRIKDMKIKIEVPAPTEMKPDRQLDPDKMMWGVVEIDPKGKRRIVGVYSMRQEAADMAAKVMRNNDFYAGWRAVFGPFSPNEDAGTSPDGTFWGVVEIDPKGKRRTAGVYSTRQQAADMADRVMRNRDVAAGWLAVFGPFSPNEDGLMSPDGTFQDPRVGANLEEEFARAEPNRVKTAMPVDIDGWYVLATPRGPSRIPLPWAADFPRTLGILAFQTTDRAIAFLDAYMEVAPANAAPFAREAQAKQIKDPDMVAYLAEKEGSRLILNARLFKEPQGRRWSFMDVPLAGWPQDQERPRERASAPRREPSVLTQRPGKRRIG